MVQRLSRGPNGLSKRSTGQAGCTGGSAARGTSRPGSREGSQAVKGFLEAGGFQNQARFTQNLKSANRVLGKEAGGCSLLGTQSKRLMAFGLCAFAGVYSRTYGASSDVASES